MDPTTLAALENFPPQLEAHYTAIPAAFRTWHPGSWDGIPSEPFTAIEQVCHIRDIEVDGYHVRFSRTLRELNPELASIDGEVLARERAYAAADVAEVFKSFRQARAKTIELIRSLTPQQLTRSAQFEGRAVSLRGLVHTLCSHDQQHLAGLQWLLARIHARPMQPSNDGA